MELLVTYYKERIARFEQELASQKPELSRIYYTRVLVFLTSILAFFFFFETFRIISFSLIPVVVIVFLLLLKRELSIKRRQLFLQNLIVVNKNEIQLLHRNFEGVNEGIEFIDKQHHYLSDLDIFGRKSLFQLLNRTATYTGKMKLASWLRNPFYDKEEILQRQEAIKELSQKPDWNHEFIAIGAENKEKGADRNLINEWLNEENIFSTHFLKIACILLPLMTVAAIVFYFLGFIGSELFIFLFFVQLIITGKYTKRINKIHDQLSRKFDSIEKYRQLIELIETGKMNSPLLVKLSSQFDSNQKKASNCIASLKKESDRLDNRMNIVIAILLNGIFLWDIRVMRRIEEWRTTYKDDFNRWIECIGELDALISLGQYAHNNPSYAYPEVLSNEFVMEGMEMGHPLIAEQVLVKNDYAIAQTPKVDLLTGANMAGKSTFLRTVGVNLILGMIGAPVCASRYRFSPVQLFTSLRTSDSLQENESFFYAELKRLHVLIELYETKIPVFFLLDEILKGTNSKDQHSGSEALIRKLVRLNGVGIVATHDVELSKLSMEYPDTVRNLCFNIHLQNDKLEFNYKLSEGVCSTMNASYLMKIMGIVD
jgi:DNA mismatch repair ATPase MutS